MRLKAIVVPMAAFVLLVPAKASQADRDFEQKQLERGLYYCEPEDDFDEEPPYVPLRNRDALKEFASYIERGWTTNQVIEGLILAMTNNYAAACSGNREKVRIVGAAIWKLGEINHPAVTNFFRHFLASDAPPDGKSYIVPYIFRYTNLEPEVMAYMRTLCVQTNFYAEVAPTVVYDMLETLSTMSDALKPTATNRVAKHIYFSLMRAKHIKAGIAWQDGEIAKLVPSYSKSVQRLSALRYIAATIDNPLERDWAQKEASKISAIPTNQLNNISWIAEDVTGGK